MRVNGFRCDVCGASAPPRPDDREPLGWFGPLSLAVTGRSGGQVAEAVEHVCSLACATAWASRVLASAH
jgi:hypothetical protein